MMEEPLHVQVAEALGWTNIQKVPIPPIVTEDQHWMGAPPPGLDLSLAITNIDRLARTITVGSGSIPNYDTDWSVTGPLIERIAGFQMFAGPRPVSFGGSKTRPADKRYCAYVMSHAEGWGPTPLIAICNLIIALAKEGKL